MESALELLFLQTSLFLPWQSLESLSSLSTNWEQCWLSMIGEPTWCRFQAMKVQGSYLPIVHVQFSNKCVVLYSWWLSSRCLLILVNPSFGDSPLLGGISTNLFLYVSTMTVPSWRRGFLFMTFRTGILRTWLTVSVSEAEISVHDMNLESLQAHDLHDHCWALPHTLPPLEYKHQHL